MISFDWKTRGYSLLEMINGELKEHNIPYKFVDLSVDDDIRWGFRKIRDKKNGKIKS